ncbi:MAG: ABC transporter substrate-binding protein [Eubacterium sp.]|nr:ABC transporter substrate-binding protein [Eubacterium sp.]
MKKKLILGLLFIVITAGCTQCSGTEEVTYEKKLARSGGVSYDEKYITVGFIQTGKESDWRDANTRDYQNTFTKEKGYNLIYIDGNSDARRQVKAMHDLISQGVDYIILDPIVEDGWDDILKLAQDSKIPVLLADRGVSADPSLYTCWIGSDFKTEGVNAVKWLADYLEKQGRKSEDINLVILEGTKGASATIGRTEGLRKEISRHKNWHILASECGNFTQGEGKAVMEQILEKHKDIDVLISENDNMMFGAMKAMTQKDVSYGVDGDVITISFDALGEAFERMMTGELMVSVECNPLIAGLCEKVIRQIEAGHEVAPVQYVQESVFTYKNAGEYSKDRKY